MATISGDELIDRLLGNPDLKAIRGVADYIVTQSPREQVTSLLLKGNSMSPFFIPNHKPQSPMTAPQWLMAVVQARMAAAAGTSRRIMVAAPMKSGSTFISEALASGLGLAKISLAMLLVRAYDYAAYEATAAAFQVDELALISACFAPRGFISHQHIAASPYLARQIEVYNLKPVLISRNVFDCLVSADDFYQKELPNKSEGARYFNNGMPFNWLELEFEDRISRFLDRYLQSYVDYYVSWLECERRSMVSPVRLSYERDILGDKQALADKLGTALDLDPDERGRLNSSLASDQTRGKTHYNKGVSGRGSAIQGRNRERVLQAFAAYSDRIDCSDILE